MKKRLCPPAWISEDRKHELYLGDSTDIVKRLKADCFLVDPPWGLKGHEGGDFKKYGKAKYVTESFVDDVDNIKTVCVPIIQHLTDTCIRGAVTPGIKCLWHYPQSLDIGCFWQPAAATHGRWGFSNYSPILYYGKDPAAGKCQQPTSRTVTEQAKKNGHPCPKPLHAWCWLLKKISLPNEIVIDPFMGSGTTGMACILEGRRFIGIEKEPRYFEIAVKQMKYAQQMLKMGYKQKAVPTTRGLFAR